MTEKDKTLYYRGLVAANIKRLRQARHMGQKELAEEILSGDEIKTASFQREELLELLEERF